VRTVTPLAVPVGGVLLVDQADHWCAWGDEGQLVRFRLDDMPLAHRRRVLAWLRSHADQLHGQQLDLLSRLRRRGQLSDDAFANETATLEATEPAVWLEETPLVRRLVQLTPAEPRSVRRRRLLPRRWWR
jgi:hypothetical protein